MSDHAVQVPSNHYVHDKYLHKPRWISFWYHQREVRSFAPERVLEVGVGTGVVTALLRSQGITVQTLDIDAALAPDLVASVTHIPLADGAVDVALAGQVLEHLPWVDVVTALREMRRVAKKGVVVSVPDRRHTLFSITLVLPFLGQRQLFVKIPSRHPHVFDGQHHWELGVPGFPISRFIDCAREAGLTLVRSYVPPDVPTKHFFVFTPRP